MSVNKDFNSTDKELLTVIEPFFYNNISPLAILDRKFNFIRVNKAYAEADGLNPQEFIGLNHFELYPSEENESIFRHVVETKKPYHKFANPFVYEKNPERGVTYWDWSLSPIINANDKVYLLILSLVNVTERVKALAEINQFFNLSVDMLCIFDFAGKLIKTNPAFEKKLAYDKGDFDSISILDIVHPEDREKTDEIIKTSLLNGTPCHFESRHLHKDKSYRWFEWNAIPDLKRGQIFASARDVSERKEGQAAIEFLAAIVDSTEDAIVTKDLYGNFLSWNKGAELIYGYTADEAIGKNISIFSSSELKNKSEEELLERIRKGEKIKHFETASRRKDRNIIYVSKTISPIYDKMGNIVGSSTIAKDITERKLYEKEIMKLDRLNILGELAASISHEVRNPMTTVKGFLQLLKNKANYKEDKKHFELMIDELDRANSIISEFLSIGTYKPVELKMQSLNRIINNIIPLLQADALAKNNYIKLELNNIPGLLLNEKQIRQVIINLVRNGLDAMSAGGKITIKTFQDKENIVLAVEDEGCGIDQEILNNLGKAFITTKKDGTGLGLATSFSICRKHGAEVNIKTGPTGSAFNIIFNKDFKQNLFCEEEYGFAHYIFNDHKFFKVLFNAIPFTIMIVNSDGRVYGINKWAGEMLDFQNQSTYFKKGGEVLHCINAINSAEGCGDKDECKHCIIRNTAMQALESNSIKRAKGEFVIVLNGVVRKLQLLLRSTPLKYREENLAIVIIEDYFDFSSSG